LGGLETPSELQGEGCTAKKEPSDEERREYVNSGSKEERNDSSVKEHRQDKRLKGLLREKEKGGEEKVRCYVR